MTRISPKDVPFNSTPSRQPLARIVNGQHAMINQFPYQVSIRSISGTSSSLCGGSVISNQFILTAAHCTKGYARFEIGFGSTLLAAPVIKMNAFTKVEHPDFNSVTLSNVNILKLKLLSQIIGKLSGHCFDPTAVADPIQQQHQRNSVAEKVSSIRALY